MAALKAGIKLGVLAEDASDVEVLAHILRKIVPSRRFSIRKFVGHGCGKLKNKCQGWAAQLALEGCSVLVLLHDRDREDIVKLRGLIEKNLQPCPVKNHLIVIPIEELEAWLLCDPAALQKTFSLKKQPKCPGNPESIPSPKEKLAEIVWKTSQKTKRYVNTIHNHRIANQLSILTLRKCKAFLPLEEFWRAI
jgi:hypothetical protein